jgi:hypothetical protein
MDVFGITVNCGTIVIADCKGLDIPWGEDWTFEMLVGDLVDAVGALLKYGLQYAGTALSENLVRALNALRCALTNLGTNAWNIVAAVYWTMVGVGEEATALEYLEIGYEHICTCQEDAMNLVRALGGGGEEDQEGDGNKIWSACSESAAVRKADAEAERERKREESAAAAARAEREAEAEAAREEQRKQLAGGSVADLEAAQLSAFEALQAEQERLAGQEVVSDAEKQALEELQRAYEATKTAKGDIVRERLAARLNQARAADGLDGLTGVIDAASARQLALAKKAQEFSRDEPTALALTAAETEILMLREELLVLAGSPEVSVREAASITELANSARSREAYNRLYAEALPLARGGDELSLEMYFQALEEQFQGAERDYNWAVAQNMPEAAELALTFEEALNDYSAGLDVQFDVVEAARQEELLPEVTLTEDDEDALMFPVDAARAKLGGQAEVEARLMVLFDAINALEGELALDKENTELAAALARARADFTFTEEYSLDTLAQQEGATAEEIAAAERAASGEPDVPEVTLDQGAADALQKKLEEQRAEEQRIRAEQVAAAEAALAAAQAEADRLAAEQAAAAAAAAAALEAQRKADAAMALIAQMEAQQAAAGRRQRRKLQGFAERPADAARQAPSDGLSVAWCTEDFVAGNFFNDCVTFTRAEKTKADEEAKSKADEQAAAVEAARLAAEAQAAQEAAVDEAWTAPVVVAGAVSVEDQMKQAKKEEMQIKLALARDKQNSQLRRDLALKQAEIAFMETTIANAKKAEADADPAAAKKAQEAAARKERALEQARQLDPQERQALILELKAALDTDDAEKVEALLEREGKASDAARAKVKELARDSKVPEDEKKEAEAAQEKASKRYLALKEYLKQEADRRAAAVAKAEAEAQALEDAKRAVELSAAERLELTKAVGAAAEWEPTDSAEGDEAAREAGIARARALRKQERNKMKALLKDAEAASKQHGADSPEFTQADAAYYRQKARVDLVTQLIQASKKAAAAAAAEVDKARFSGELSARDQRALAKEIAAYRAATNAAGRADADAADALLATFEHDLQFAAETLGKEVEKKGDKADDDLKRSYYDAIARYEWVSAELGPDSPAKAAARAAAVAAAAEAALRALTGSIGEAKAVADRDDKLSPLGAVLRAIDAASKGTSPLPALLADARSSKSMEQVLAAVAEDKKLARKLAKRLLAAQTGDEVAQAFAKIAELVATQGTDDPEELLRAKLDALVSRYVAQGELAVSGIKQAYAKAAEAATTLDALGAALGAAAQAADDRLGEILAAMRQAVAPLAGAYDLTDANAELATALAAGRAEVRLNHARATASLQARDFDRDLKERLEAAGTEAAVVEILTSAAEETARLTQQLDDQLNEVLDEARAAPGLEERIPEAEAYADEIRADQARAFGQAQAGAELAAAGAQAALALQALASRLDGDLGEANSNDEVDAALGSAEQRLASQTRSRNSQLDEIIETHGLASVEGGKKTDAEKLAAALRKALGRDIEKAEAKAIQAADRRKAELERAAAGRARAVLDEAKARVSAAGEAAAGYAVKRGLLVEELSAADDTAAEALQAQVTALEAQIKEQDDLKAAAEIEVTRLKEAKENSDTLAGLADEIASAKAETDSIIDGLKAAQEALRAGIEVRAAAIPKLEAQLAGLRQTANTESDAKKQTQAFAVVEAAAANIAGLEALSRDDERLLEQYTTAIRGTKNGLRVTMAILLAEKTNAEMLVAIKQDMNGAQDLDMLDLKRAALVTAKAAAADPAPIQAEIDELDARKATINTMRAELGPRVDELK